jgi:hypothetical protein
MPSHYDPAAHGWTAFPDEGFIDCVGPKRTMRDAGIATGLIGSVR